MDRIKYELGVFANGLAKYQNPCAIMDDELVLDTMELAAKRLYAEVVLFRAKKQINETTRGVKVSMEVKAKRIGQQGGKSDEDR